MFDDEKEVYLDKEPVTDWSTHQIGDLHDSDHQPEPEDNTDRDD